MESGESKNSEDSEEPAEASDKNATSKMTDQDQSMLNE